MIIVLGLPVIVYSSLNTKLPFLSRLSATNVRLTYSNCCVILKCRDEFINDVASNSQAH